MISKMKIFFLITLLLIGVTIEKKTKDVKKKMLTEEEKIKNNIRSLKRKQRAL